MIQINSIRRLIGAGRIVLTIFFVLSKSAYGNILLRVDVPDIAFVGDSANLSCHYDLRHTQLYSLKWYHNKTEFYRFVPTERRTPPITIRQSKYFLLRELYRSQRRITLRLDNLATSGSGEYRCELIAEHPTFRTEYLAKHMTVLNDRLRDPVLFNAKELYSPEDAIEIGCQPKIPFMAFPQPIITWYIDGKQVPKEQTSRYGYKHGIGYYGKNLVIPAEEAFQDKQRLTVECRISIGHLIKSIGKEIRIRRRLVSYVNGFYSGGCGNTWKTLYVTLAFFLHINNTVL